MNINSGGTIRFRVVLDQDPALYKSIYAVAYTNSSNPALFYFGVKNGYYEITNGSVENQVICTVPASFTKTMSGPLMFELRLDKSNTDELIAIGAKDTGVRVLKTISSRIE